MEPSQLSRLIGWHILIPTIQGRRVYLHNFPTGSAELWEQSRGEVVLDTHEDADFCFYWNPISTAIFPGRHGYAVIADTSVFNDPKGLASQYSLVPESYPRLVLPLGDSEQLLRGMYMHLPGRKLARFAIYFAVLLLRIGIRVPLSRRRLWIFPGKGTPFGDDPILYLGSSGEDRKTTILPTGDCRIYKLGTTDIAQKALHREAEALSVMANTPLAGFIPEFSGLKVDKQSTLLEQGYRKRQYIGKRKLRAEAIRFLALLSKVGSERRTVDMGEGSLSIQGHRSHGDFTPWNMIWTDRGIFVFDWEESKVWAPALFDAFQFVVYPILFSSQERNPKIVARDANKFALEVAQLAGIDSPLVALHWSLWLQDTCEKHPTNLLFEMMEK